MTSVITLLGMDGTDRDWQLLAAHLPRAVALVASRDLYERLLEQYPEEELPLQIPVVPLKHCFYSIGESLERGNVLVLATGDPLFFGIARRILERFPSHEVSVLPALSSMQIAFARFKIPWDDVRFISLHGRELHGLAAKVLCHAKVFFLTDGLNSPDSIAKRLLKSCDAELLSGVSCYVGECLGSTRERLFSGSLQEMAAQSFRQPNVMILLNPEKGGEETGYPGFGLKEKEIIHSRGLLTKNEVRAAAIHALRLCNDGTLWDVGAGSGSVGLEAARLFPSLQVISIEKEALQWQNIRQNILKFKAVNMQLVQGMAPNALLDLPRPERIFVGGSGGNLDTILRHCVRSLALGGIIVVTAVIANTAKMAPQILYDLGLEVEIVDIAVSRSTYPSGEEIRFNPIKIIVAIKSHKESVHEPKS